jgi:hypothetical protein
MCIRDSYNPADPFDASVGPSREITQVAATIGWVLSSVFAALGSAMLVFWLARRLRAATRPSEDSRHQSLGYGSAALEPQEPDGVITIPPATQGWETYRDSAGDDHS